MTKARNLADNALTTVSPTELGYVDGVTSSIQTQLDAKIAKSTVTAKGDVIAATASATVSNLAVGANDTVLTADSTAATGIKWATPASGSMTQLATGTLSGTRTTISSISQSYKNLYLIVTGAYVNIGSTIAYTLNGNDTSVYYRARIPLDTGTISATSSPEANFRPSGVNVPTTTNATTDILTIQNYTTTTPHFMTHQESSLVTGNAGYAAFGNFAVSAAITSIGITTRDLTSTFSGGTYTLFGVN
jgi:hypothetical protein